MSAPDLKYRATYNLDRRFKVEFVLDAQAHRLDCYWLPHQPKGRKAQSLLPAYRKARDEFMGSLGLDTLVVEL